MPCLSKILVSLATHKTDEDPGVVEIYDVFNLSADKDGCASKVNKAAAMSETRCRIFCRINNPP
jgi:hypothetical protein